MERLRVVQEEQCGRPRSWSQGSVKEREQRAGRSPFLAGLSPRAAARGQPSGALSRSSSAIGGRGVESERRNGRERRIERGRERERGEQKQSKALNPFLVDMQRRWKSDSGVRDSITRRQSFAAASTKFDAVTFTLLLERLREKSIASAEAVGFDLFPCEGTSDAIDTSATAAPDVVTEITVTSDEIEEGTQSVTGSEVVAVYDAATEEVPTGSLPLSRSVILRSQSVIETQRESRDGSKDETPSRTDNYTPTLSVTSHRSPSGLRRSSAPERKEEMAEKREKREPEAKGTTGRYSNLQDTVEVRTAQGQWYRGGRDSNGRMHGWGMLERPTASGGSMRYVGRLTHGRLSGWARMEYSNGDCYEGEVEEGRMQGRGRMLYSAGASYLGHWRRGAKHGLGEYLDPKRDTLYNGVHEDGRREGWGTLQVADVCFVGQFRQGGMSRGRLTWDCGDYYQGAFSQGLYEGQAELLQRGCLYSGGFKAGKRHGTGEWRRLSSKASYSGSWAHDRPNGHGRLVLDNGRAYEGEFIEGVPSGYGTLTTAEGEEVEGFFADGDFIQEAGDILQFC